MSLCLNDKTVHLKSRERTISCIVCYVNSMNISKLRTHGRSEQDVMSAQSLQSCLTICDIMDCRPPGSTVHGILQARILDRVVLPSLRRSF